MVGIRELMRISRIARPGAIYDASATSQTFTERVNCRCSNREWGDSEYGKEENIQTEIRSDFGHMPGYQGFWRNSTECEYGESFEENREIGKSKTRFTVANLIFLKHAICKLKGAEKYQIKFSGVDWAGGEIAIEIHCDAGGY